VLFRCFSDVKTAVWISFATGMTTGLDLEILLENSGLVRRKSVFYFNKIAKSFTLVSFSQVLCNFPHSSFYFTICLTIINTTLFTIIFIVICAVNLPTKAGNAAKTNRMDRTEDLTTTRAVRSQGDRVTPL